MPRAMVHSWSEKVQLVLRPRDGACGRDEGPLQRFPAFPTCAIPRGVPDRIVHPQTEQIQAVSRLGDNGWRRYEYTTRRLPGALHDAGPITLRPVLLDRNTIDDGVHALTDIADLAPSISTTCASSAQYGTSFRISACLCQFVREDASARQTIHQLAL